MNKVLVSLSCCLIVLAFAGCDQQNHKPHKQGEITSQTAKDIFPEVMVGVWEAEVSEISKWGIKFEPDGSIRKIIHSLAGPVNLSDGGIYLEGPDPNTYAMFVIGPCEAKYYPKTDELKVKIILDHYEMKLPNGVLEGRIESYFSGPVSKDGKTWKADWVDYSWLEGADPPDDPNIIEANPEKLTFTKLDIK